MIVVLVGRRKSCSAVIVTRLSHTLYEKYTECINGRCEHPLGYGVVYEPIYFSFVLSCRLFCCTDGFRISARIWELEDALWNPDGTYGAKLATRTKQQYKEPASAVQSA